MLAADLLVLLSMALFGTYFIFLRFCPQIPTLVFLLAFQIVGACVLGIQLFFTKRQLLTSKAWLFLCFLALVASGNDLCYFAGLRMTAIANAAVAHQSVSIFLLLLAPLLLGEKTRKSEWFAMCVALVGIAILYSDRMGFGQRQDAMGISLAVLSGLFYALLIVLYKLLQDMKLSVTTINWWRYLFSSILISPFVLYAQPFQPNISDVLILVAFGFLFAVVASFLHIYAIGRTRAMHVSILGKSEPVFATIYAFVFLKEVPTIQAIIGGALIIGASIWLTMQSHDHSPSNS